jgi:hypothetical protein
MRVSGRLCTGFSGIALLVSACASEPKPLAEPTTAAPPPVSIDAAPAEPPTVRLDASGEKTLGGWSFELSSIEDGKASVALARGEFVELFELGAGESDWFRGVFVEVIDVGQDVGLRIGVPVAPARKVVRTKIEKGKEVPLTSGWRVRFRSHSHKTVASGGPSSPLITYIEYVPDDGEPVEEQYNLHPPEESSWWWRNVEFRQHEHAYDEWIDVTITEHELEYLQ